MKFNYPSLGIIIFFLIWCLHFQTSDGRLDNDDCEDEDVDPHDMGSYSHTSKCNRSPPSGARRGSYRRSGNAYHEREVEEVVVKRAVYLTSGHPQISPDKLHHHRHPPEKLLDFENSRHNEDSAFIAKLKHDDRQEQYRGVGGMPIVEFTEETTKYSRHECVCPTIDQAPLMTYIRRIVGSLMDQMGVHNHHFGPDETITIDLQGEISYKSYMDLTLFLSSTETDVEKSLTMIQTVSEIMSNLIHPNSPVETLTFSYETIQFKYPFLLTPKFWLAAFSVGLLGFTILVLCCLILYARHSPTKLLTYSSMLFFVASCVWIYFENYEKAIAENASRLQQFDSMPRDCQPHTFSYWELFTYFVRVDIMGYENQCDQYYRESSVDPFYRYTPVEAISEAAARFIFHPMGYIGSKTGDFFKEFSNVFPWWMRPVVLILVFLTVFFSLFPYKIKTPFLSIEPAYRPAEPIQPPPPPLQPQLQDGPQAEPRPQIIDVPNMIVPLHTLDAATDTDDLEDFIRQQQAGNDEVPVQPPPPPIVSSPSRAQHLWRLLLPRFQEFCDVCSRILKFLLCLLREIPTIPQEGVANRVPHPNNAPENYH